MDQAIPNVAPSASNFDDLGLAGTSSRAKGLARIAQEVASCEACPRLVEWRRQVGIEKRAAYRQWPYWSRGVPAFGDPEAPVMVVGLAPAAHGANRTGRMFTGDRSGDWLFGALHRAGFANQATSYARGDGLVLKQLLISAPVRCAPPANKPTKKERDVCSEFLKRELELVKPKVCLVLGGFAYAMLCTHFGVRPRPKFGHGVEVETKAGPTIVCSYHVSQQNTFTGRLTEQMLDTVFDRVIELAQLQDLQAKRRSE